MIEMIAQYGFYIVLGLILVVGIVCYVVNQKKSIKEWLLFAVMEAEKAFGEKTGQLKLRQVYENFIRLFPFFSMFIKFETFSKWVNSALREMKKVLASSEAIQKCIGVTVETDNVNPEEKGDDDGLGSTE